METYEEKLARTREKYRESVLKVASARHCAILIEPPKPKAKVTPKAKPKNNKK
jgi:hypothetical protein